MEPVTLPVVVVGGGLAGLSATLAASLAGATLVILLEKETVLGGNSAKAISGITAAVTPWQHDVSDSLDSFAMDHFLSCRGEDPLLPPSTLVAAGLQQDESSSLFSELLWYKPRNDFLLSRAAYDPSLASLLVNESKAAIEFLTKNGCVLDELVHLRGHSVPRSLRCHSSMGPVGKHIITTLLARVLALVERGGVEIVCSARVIKLNAVSCPRNIVRVVGVTYSLNDAEVLLKASSVILTTGGFAASGMVADSILGRVRPDLIGLPTTNGIFAMGDGLRLSQDIGAETCGLEYVQLHPTAFIHPASPHDHCKIVAPERFRSVGAILLNGRCNRFCNELCSSDKLVRVMRRCIRFVDGAANACPIFLLFDSVMANRYGQCSVDAYVAKGVLVTGPLDGVLTFFHEYSKDETPLFQLATSLSRTLQHYNAAAAGEVSDDWGKTLFPNPFTVGDAQRYYVGLVTPAVHYCLGGVKVNASCEVLTKRGRPNVHSSITGVEGLGAIPGLLAAGEVVGGCHGRNRLGGCSLLECVVFGRIAGHRAGRSIASDACKKPLSAVEWSPLRLREKQLFAAKIKMFRFDLPSMFQCLEMNPGDYIQVRTNDGEEMRYYSPVSRLDALGYIDLLVKISDDGRMTRYLDGLSVGAMVAFRGPMGGIPFNLHLRNPELGIRNLVLVAGGVGISAMLQIIRHILHNQRWDIQLTLLYCAASVDDLVFADSLMEMSRRHVTFSVVLSVDVAPSQGWFGHVGLIDNALLKAVCPPRPASDCRVCVCGSKPMCRAVVALLTDPLGPIAFEEHQVFSYL